MTNEENSQAEQSARRVQVNLESSAVIGQVGDNIQVDRGDYVAGDKIVYRGLSTEEVTALFLKIKREDQPKVWNGINPYPGLRAFQEGDAKYFFGREKLVDELLQRLETSSFIVIAGPSGSGKSSVARAGLLQALRQGRVDGSQSWLMATMSPQGDPLAQLALAMQRATKAEALGEKIKVEGGENPQLLAEAVEMYLTDDPRQRFVLLVDQFEETFTQTKDPLAQAAFINLLTGAVQPPESRVIVLLSMRSDFVSHCAHFAQLRTMMSRQFQLVGTMEPNDLAKAISLPAMEVGVSIEAALVSRIIEDMKGEPGALPLVSFTLRDLFEAEKTRIGEPMDITLREYLDRGGIENALARHADHIFGTFSRAQQELAKNVFSRLIEVGQGRADTRRTAAIGELVPAGAGGAEVTAVINALADENVRLITTKGVESGEEIAEARNTETSVTIAHEKLIDAWPWLRRLVDENREIIALQNQISDEAQKWAEHNDPGFLYRGGRLIQVEEKLDDLRPGLNSLSLRFIEASLAQREKERRQSRRNQIVFVSLLGLLLIGTAVAAVLFSEQATTNANIAATANAASTLAIRSQDLAFAESTRAFNNEGTAQAEAARAIANQEIANAEATRAIAAEQSANAEATKAIAAEQSAEAERNIAILQSNRAIAQSFIARSRAMAGSQPTNGELAQARLYALEGERLNADFGSATEKATSKRWLLSLAYDHAIPYQPLATLNEHNDTVWSTAWNGDGDRLASAATDNKIIIWDTETWQPVQTLDAHADIVRSVAWDENSGRLASASQDNTVIIWDTESWQPVQTLDGHTDWVFSVDWAADGRRLASASGDGTIIIWDTDTWQSLQTLSGHTDRVRSVDWAADGRRLASASNDGTIIIWDTDTWLPVETLEEHTSNVLSVAWNEEGSRLASGGADNQLIIWDTDTWQPLQKRTDHSDWVFSADWAADGRRLASASSDGTIIIWDTEIWQPLTTLTDHEGIVLSVAWNGDDRRLASAADDGTIIIWDMASWQPWTVLDEHEDWVRSTVWNQDDSLMASGSDDETIIIWDTESWRPLHTLSNQSGGHADGILTLAWSADGGRLASAACRQRNQDRRECNEGEIIIWDTAAWEPLEILNAHEQWIWSLAWNHDGSRLASSAADDTIIIWDTTTWQPLERLTNHTNWVWDVAWNHDGSRLASASCAGGGNSFCGEGEIIIWDAATWQPLQTLSRHTDIVRSVDWSSDGSRLASAANDNTIIIWDTATWEPLQTLRDHTDNVRSVDWRSDDTLLASAADDDKIIIWDTLSWQPLRTLTGHTENIWSATWSRDGSRLASASYDHTAIIWEFPDQQGLQCELAGRNLSLAEWQAVIADQDYHCTCGDWPPGEGASGCG